MKNKVQRNSKARDQFEDKKHSGNPNSFSLESSASAQQRQPARIFKIPHPENAFILAAIIQQSSDAILSTDLNGIVTSWNASAEKIFGYSMEEIVGCPIGILIPSESKGEERSILEKICRGERLLHYTTLRMRKDGRKGNVSLMISPIRDASGEIVGMTEIARDVGEERRIHRAYRELAAIVECSEDAIASKDLNGIVRTWNRSAERLFGYTPEEMIGCPITTIIPPEYIDDEARILSKIRRGERIEHFETVRITKSGERIEVSLTISPVRDELGRVIGAAKIVRDITERNRIDRDLRRAEKLAASGRLAATIAHEINNPMQSLTNLFALITDSVSEDNPLRPLVAMAESELERMAHITRQMLSFHRESTKTSLARVDNLLEDVVKLYTTRLRTESIVLEKKYEHVELIQAFPLELQQAFANLLNNAIEAVGSGGKIRVHLSQRKRVGKQTGVQIVIADNGSGIKPEIRKRVFEPFFTTKEERGSGLGLWVVRSIVEKHDGTLRMRSSTKPGRSGTAFSIFLPNVPVLRMESKNPEPMLRATG